MAKRVFSDEFLATQTREAALARWNDKRTREHIIEGIKTGRGQTPEARAKLKAAQQAHWADPDKRARHIEAIRAAMARPEVRAKIKAAQEDLDRRVAQSFSAREAWDGKPRTRRARGPFVADGKPIKCQCCGRPFNRTRRPELDHRLAMMFGGTDATSNAQWLCAMCHSFKTGMEATILSAMGR